MERLAIIKIILKQKAGWFKTGKLEFCFLIKSNKTEWLKYFFKNVNFLLACFFRYVQTFEKSGGYQNAVLSVMLEFHHRFLLV